MSTRYAVAYDVEEDTTRRRIRKTLRSFGAWKQYSVFEVDLTDVEMQELEEKLRTRMSDSNGEVAVRFYEVREVKEMKNFETEDDGRRRIV